MRSFENGDSILCRPADCREDFRQAFRLLYDKYLESKLTCPNPLKMRIAAHQLWPESEILVAKQNRRVVGTVTLIGDGPRKLPLDKIFPRELRSLRREGLRILEVGCLAAIADRNHLHSPIYLALTRATIQHARLRDCDRMLAAVHPRHSKFYERAMAFRRLSGEVPYDSVEGSLAVCVAGNPSDPSEYRQPWRELFFGGEQPQANCGAGGKMSPADRRYFANLLERSYGSASRQAA